MIWRTYVRIYRSALLGALILTAGGAARGGEIAAIVADISPGVTEFGLFDYLSPGMQVSLAENEWITLGYLNSCIEETVTGGTARIGKTQSEVTGGTVERRVVECDGGNLVLTAEQSDRAGVAVMRELENGIEVELTVHALSPYFRFLGEAPTLTLERLDRPQNPIILEAGSDGIDLAAAGISLKKGGLYRARAGEREITFRVDKFARPGAMPLLSRLIPL
jgi:hypothetical protein